MKPSNISFQSTKYYSFFLIFILMISGCKPHTQTINTTLQNILEKELTNHIIGLQASIIDPENQIQWNGASGFFDFSSNVEMKPHNTFRIASVTKTFTAASVLRLWELQLIELDAPIKKYISNEHIDILIEGGYAPDIITIRHLLTHSAGLGDYTRSHKYDLSFMKKRHVWSRTEQIEDLVKFSEPMGKPGKQFSYSDSGYILLGEIIENITRKPLGKAINELLGLDKLGMKYTQMEEFDGCFSGNRIHQYLNGTDTYNFHPSFDYYGGGGLVSNTSELALFYHNLFNNKVFSKNSTLSKMICDVEYDQDPEMDYRMGIWQIDINGNKAYTHTGFWGTQVIHLPEKNITIAVNYSQHWNTKEAAPVIPKLLDALSLITRT